MVSSFRDNIGKLDKITAAFPDVEIIPVDCAGNQGVRKVSIEDAKKWNYEVSDDDFSNLFTYVLSEINSGDIEAGSVPSAVGDILGIPNIGLKNQALAKVISEKVNEIIRLYKSNRQG